MMNVPLSPTGDVVEFEAAPASGLAAPLSAAKATVAPDPPCELPIAPPEEAAEATMGAGWPRAIQAEKRRHSSFLFVSLS